jgi:predicted PolB exonuclease-like 3'-5' exonuclease
MDGSKVAKYHEDGKDKEIYEYCCVDVEVTRQIYKKMNFERIELLK